ncbi:transporter substrate-binding domain-containing protein [Streptococcus parasuis]|jgi:L-cystine transport system substrate-binding protein|uniref:transporter substrate-binding domain-containing protein n=1 Tax=Streptococcus parasuis TaxID=1501662 RepID=UPI00289CAB09|nr:transporter substrate-binding domain-containing protein [Streptococcus parasuis]
MKKYFYIVVVVFLAFFFIFKNSAATKDVSGDSNKVTVALEQNTQPLSYTNDKGELVGYEVEIIENVNKVIEGYEIAIESVSAEAAEVGIESGKYDLVGGGLFKTEAREKKYLFPTENTGVSTIEIYKRAEDEDIQTLEDLVGRKISPVTANGGIFNLLTTYNNENKDNQITIPLGESGELAQRYQGLADGKYDAVVMPSNFGADTIIEQLGLDIVTGDEPVQVNGTYFIISKDQKEFKDAFDKAIKKLKDDGTLSELSKKWFGEDMFQYEITEQ